ncbi:hypothetical protein K438DRAFT_2025927 [Mycena galopus ATCC 62051]|nr:hypothetical protein K438DRAFT_2025927 [Mycena galopus ATCC 62051]
MLDGDANIHARLPCRKIRLCCLHVLFGSVDDTRRRKIAEAEVAQLENKQRIEDAEALKFTDLRYSFSSSSVKIEWSILDGMRIVSKHYNDPRLRRPAPQSPACSPVVSRPQAFAVLTSTRLASDETIRGYIPFPDRRFYSTPPPYDPAPRYSTKYQPEYKYSNAPVTLAPPMPPTMQRSPALRLFSIASSATAACLQVVRVPPPATCLYGSDRQADGPGDGNEEVWDDELAITADGAKYQPIRVLICASHRADDALNVSPPVRSVWHPHHRRYRAPRSHRNLRETKLARQRPVPSFHHLSVLLRRSGVRAAHLCTLPPLVSAASNGSAETGDSEDAWVDKDDVTVTIDHDDRGDWMLTPVPACVWSFGSITELSSACRNGIIVAAFTPRRLRRAAGIHIRHSRYGAEAAHAIVMFERETTPVCSSASQSESQTMKWGGRKAEYLLPLAFSVAFCASLGFLTPFHRLLLSY